jgi:outer membrane protein assembly factor BamA
MTFLILIFLSYHSGAWPLLNIAPLSTSNHCGCRSSESHSFWQQKPPFERIAHVVVRGATHVAAERTIRNCGLRPNRRADAKTVEACTEQIKRAYFRKGFIRVAVSVTQEPAPTHTKNQRFVNLTLQIQEGAKYLIHKIEFTGNRTTRHRIAQRATGLNLADAYDPNQIERWIVGLNRLNRFERVKRDDVEVTIDDDEHTVAVLFHVREK